MILEELFTPVKPRGSAKVLQTEISFSQFIAIGQKTSTSTSQWGEGANYRVVLDVRPEHEPAARAGLGETLSQLDHRALGVDVDLGFEPTPTNLAEWIFKQISTHAPVLRVSLRRGDGRVFSYGQS